METKHTALVTGASMGIGLEFARVLAEHRHDLVLVARSKDKLEALAAELTSKYGIKASAIACDLSKIDEVESLPSKVEKTGAKIDFLVNNAGFGEMGFFTDTEWKKERMMIDVNVTALTFLMKHYAQEMAKRGGGRICNVASTAAFQPGPKMAVYFATKSYVLSLSEAVAAELEGTGVTITALCPGATSSNFFDNANMKNSRLATTGFLPKAADVARYGYEATIEGRTVAIHGIVNTILAESVRFIPRKVVTRIARKLL